MPEQDSQNSSRKHRLQMDLMIKEGDYRKNEQRKVQLDVEMRQIKKKMDLLNVDLSQFKKELAKIDPEQMMLAGEIKKLKKEIAEL